ncbi:hypothetical protein P7C70_g1493, partial [Phenoliferia sp. Uapishka_3]
MSEKSSKQQKEWRPSDFLPIPARGRVTFLTAATLFFLFSAYLTLQKGNTVELDLPPIDGAEIKRWRGKTSEFGMEFGMGIHSVPTVAELLSPQAPARSFYDSLRNDLRYLTADSWSGMTGQFTSAIALIHLARRTQRVAIVPSWQDDTHYGDAVVSMGLLFDLQGYREKTGTLLVDFADVKEIDPDHKTTETDLIGCFKGANGFMNGVSFPAHNIQQQIYPRLPRRGASSKDSAEALILFDFEEESRLKSSEAFATREGMDLPRNVRDGQLLCYTSLWDLQQADGGFSKSATAALMPKPLSGFHTEWWDVGQHINFTLPIWEIAMNAVEQTIGGPLPDHIVTVHIRRGDFQDKCGDKPDCLPTAANYAPHVASMLDRCPPGGVVLVTTDETEDQAFLESLDARGWFRIDHPKLGTEMVLKERFGSGYKWADAAVDQAILSLGDHFVGTDGSQVSWVSAERVSAWQGGTFSLVGLECPPAIPYSDANINSQVDEYLYRIYLCNKVTALTIPMKAQLVELTGLREAAVYHHFQQIRNPKQSAPELWLKEMDLLRDLPIPVANPNFRPALPMDVSKV